MRVLCKQLLFGAKHAANKQQPQPITDARVTLVTLSRSARYRTYHYRDDDLPLEYRPRLGATPTQLLVPPPHSMLIYVCGPQCAGKKTLARYLSDTLGFVQIDHAQVSHENEPQHAQSQPPSLMSSCWRQDTVAVIVQHPSQRKSLMNLLARPWVLIVYVDSPVLTRFQRSCKEPAHSEKWSSFLSFTEREHSVSSACHDSHYQLSAHNRRDTSNEIDRHQLYKLAHIRIFNDFDSIQLFHQALEQIHFTDVRRLRPTWDTYFMSLARLTAQRTNCMKRRVGCVIARDRRVVATGYNGTPAGVTNCFEGGCPRCNQQCVQGVGLELCLCLHAEENAIIEAGRQRCQGSTLYTSVFPCILCSKKIVQAGVSRVAFDSDYGAHNSASEMLLKAGGVIIDKIVADDECARITSLAKHRSYT